MSLRPDYVFITWQTHGQRLLGIQPCIPLRSNGLVFAVLVFMESLSNITTANNKNWLYMVYLLTQCSSSFNINEKTR